MADGAERLTRGQCDECGSMVQLADPCSGAHGKWTDVDEIVRSLGSLTLGALEFSHRVYRSSQRSAARARFGPSRSACPRAGRSACGGCERRVGRAGGRRAARGAAAAPAVGRASLRRGPGRCTEPEVLLHGWGPGCSVLTSAPCGSAWDGKSIIPCVAGAQRNQLPVDCPSRERGCNSSSALSL